MSVVRGRQLNGRPQSYTAPPAGVAPGLVGSLAAGTPTVTTIPVTFTAPATGTAPFTYTGYTSPHGASAWTLNSGTFLASTASAFIGLMGATDYDFEIVATNASGSSTTQSLGGVTTATYVPPVFTGNANRYDIVLSASSVAPGSPVTGTLCPNGKWNGETITLAAVSGSGAFSPATVTTTSGSSSLVSFTYTPSAPGEHAIGGTNSGALYNPRAAPLNAFASSSGTSRALTVAVAAANNGQVHDPQPRQFATLATLASGFSGVSTAQGYASIAINVSAIGGATNGLWVRLYDADSSGAVSGTPGSGTALHSSPVQVYGAISATGVIHVMLPASLKFYFVDIATDAAFTAPARVPQRVVVGLGIGMMGRSQEAGICQWYYDNSTPTGETWANTLSAYSSDVRYEPNPFIYYRQTGAAQGASHADGSDPNGPSGGAQAAGRIIAATLGVNVFFVGVAATGGGVDSFINHDGSLTGGPAYSFSDAGTDFRWLWAASLDGWDNASSSYPGTYAEYQTRYTAAMDYIARTFPACAVQGWGGGGTGRPEPNGSAAITPGDYPGTDNPGPGAARLQNIFEQAELTNPMVVSKGNHAWAQFVGGHGSKSSRRIYAQPGLRQLLSAELTINGGLQTQARGPSLLSTGTCSAASRIVRIFGKLNGGGGLQTVQITQNDPNYSVSFNTATAAQLADLFSLYPPSPGYWTFASNPTPTTVQTGPRIQISSVAINYSNLPAGADFSLDATLAGSSGVVLFDNISTSTGSMPSAMVAHWAADLQASASNGGYIVQAVSGGVPPPSLATFITDTQVSSPWEWGRHVRPALDIAITVGA